MVNCLLETRNKKLWPQASVIARSVCDAAILSLMILNLGPAPGSWVMGPGTLVTGQPIS